MRTFAGNDAKGRPVQSSRTVRGTRKDALRVAAEMSLRRPTAVVHRVTVAQMLDLWAENRAPSWSPSTVLNQAQSYPVGEVGSHCRAATRLV